MKKKKCDFCKDKGYHESHNQVCLCDCVNPLDCDKIDDNDTFEEIHGE